MDGSVATLHRFPIKGLSPERLDSATLEPGRYFPGDRLYAIENGPSAFDEAAPCHLPKSAFLMLMRNERLARLKTTYDAAAGRLSIHLDGETACAGDLTSATGRAAIEDFLSRFCRDELRGEPRLRAAAPDFRFTDSRQGFVSVLNLSSVRAVEAAVGRPVDPLRFRANIALEGFAPWAENEWVGRTLRVGDSLLAISALTDRCAATEVDPTTGARDMPVVKTLVKRFGHNVCGVYASVVEGGPLRTGDRATLA